MKMTCNLPFEKKQHHNHGRTPHSHVCKDKLHVCVCCVSLGQLYAARAKLI